jgi:hypothetical protein
MEDTMQAANYTNEQGKTIEVVIVGEDVLISGDPCYIVHKATAQNRMAVWAVAKDLIALSDRP